MVVPLFAVVIAIAVLICFALLSLTRKWSACFWVSLTLVAVSGLLSVVSYYEVPEDSLALSADAEVLEPGYYVVFNKTFDQVHSEGKIIFQAAGVMQIEYDFRVTDADRALFVSHRAEIVSAGSTEQFIFDRMGPAFVEYIATRDLDALDSFLDVFRSTYGVTVENGRLGIILQQ